MRAEPRQDLGSAPGSETPTPLYRTIVADPPWDYGRDNARQPSITHGGKGERIERDLGYETLSPEEIAELPVREAADRDARLFLWTTNRHLLFAFAVLSAWGFEYRQTLIWNKTGNPSPFGGSVAPNHAEFLLVAQCGSPPVSSRLPSSVISVPAQVFGHSRKPEMFLDLVESVSPGPYLELFARRQRLGWDTWGNEALEHVTLDTGAERSPSAERTKDGRSGGGR